jgi:arginyl-tRNA synthetase
MIEDRLARIVREALEGARGELGIPDELGDVVVEVEASRRKEFGDFTTNVALSLAARVETDPRVVAERLVAHLPTDELIERAEVAGPGFVNIFVRTGWLHDVVREAVGRGERYGWAERIGRSIQVEFVSANPTGPLHVGHARNAALGDALARVLEAAGWRVDREYYFNDAGGQMDRFGASVEARYLQVLGRDADVPEDGYHGDYVMEIARDIAREHRGALADLAPEERLARLRDEGARRVLQGIRATLDRFGVRFDSYISESQLAESGEIEAAVKRLRDAGFVYESEGAVWFRSTAFGDDKDRPLIRGNGTHTYFAADCAYVIDKFAREFDHMIYVWGADHHGDVVRVRGAVEALGYDPNAVEMVIYQFVSFLRGGQPVKMSKRAGTFITLDELIDEVGTDAARFTLLLHSNDSPMNFDIEDVRRRSMENPVYYVQYGHARIASILRHAADQGVTMKPVEEVDLGPLSSQTELDLLRAMAEMPDLVERAADLRAPHRLTHYAQQLAALFHRFYTECRVVTDDEPLTQARLWLCAAAKQTIANVLALLGVSAPESMERIDV